VSTRTLVTKAATVLTAVQIPSKTVAAGHFNPADIATINKAILLDPVNNAAAAAQQTWQNLTPNGLLTVPNRGQLKCFPGDVVAVDLSGNVIIVSAYSIAQGLSWTLT
jgi:hypothetical protein